MSTESTPTTPSPYLIQVSENIPTLQECTDFVNLPSCGAISSFLGITRDNFQNKKVLQLRYEAYVPMAEKVLHQLCQNAQSQFKQIERIAIVHIVGDCPVGKASVIICASSPHRRESLDCVSFLIDELKANAPIWKLEMYEGHDGVLFATNYPKFTLY